jgi:integrase
MPVSPRGNSWQAQVNSKGQRYRRNFDSKTDALRWEAGAKAAILNGEPVDMGELVRRKAGVPHTLGELIDHVYTTHWAPMKGGEKSLINARSIGKQIGMSMAVAKITRTEIDMARAALLKGGNSPATVNRKVAALAKALAIAEDMEVIERRPKCVKYKESEHRIRRFTPEEERRAIAYFEYIGQQDMMDYVILSLDTGMRQSEVIGLRWGQVEPDKVTLWGDATKSGKNRTVPLTERAKRVLTQRRELDVNEVFPGLQQSAVGHYWDRFRETMGLMDDRFFVPHILRHEFCSRLADRGVNAAVIQQLAGHSSLMTTQRYIHIAAHALVAAMKALEDKGLVAT